MGNQSEAQEAEQGLVQLAVAEVGVGQGNEAALEREEDALDELLWLDWGAQLVGALGAGPRALDIFLLLDEGGGLELAGHMRWWGLVWLWLLVLVLIFVGVIGWLHVGHVVHGHAGSCTDA